MASTPPNDLSAKPDWQPLAYGIAVQFHAPIKLERKTGLEFAPQLTSAIDARNVDLSENAWLFSQPLGANPASVMRVGVTPNEIQMAADFPTDALDLFRLRWGLVLDTFHKAFKPALMLASSALIRGTLQIGGGDAREFLASKVMNCDLANFSGIGRPIHMLGLRLFLPPFKIAHEPSEKGKGRKKSAPKIVDSADWIADVKAESLINDPTQLFLEVQAQWQSARQWTEQASKDAVEHVSVAMDFLRKKFIPFLTKNQQTQGD